jgi:hypothetical protein
VEKTSFHFQGSEILVGLFCFSLYRDCNEKLIFMQSNVPIFRVLQLVQIPCTITELSSVTAQACVRYLFLNISTQIEILMKVIHSRIEQLYKTTLWLPSVIEK